MVTIDANNHWKWLPEEFWFLCNVRKSESSKSSTLSSNNKHLLTDSNGTNNIFTFFCVIELIHVINWVDIWFLLDKPTNLSTKFSITYLSSWFKHSKSWCLTFILPQVNIILWTNNNMCSWHSINSHIKGNLFTFNCCTNRITKINLSDFLVRFWKNSTKFTLTFYLSKLFHIFHKLLVCFSIPKNNTKLYSVRFLESKD